MRIYSLYFYHERAAFLSVQVHDITDSLSVYRLSSSEKQGTPAHALELEAILKNLKVYRDKQEVLGAPAVVGTDTLQAGKVGGGGATF